MNVSSTGLKDYLEYASIYKGTSPKKKTDLIEMIVDGCMTRTLNKKDLEDKPIKQAKKILNENNITVDSLPGYGNMRLREKKLNHKSKKKLLSKFDNYSFKLKE